MKKAEEKPAVEMTVGGKPKSGASHPPWKSLRDSHIPTARRLLYIFKTFARKEPSSAIASGYGFRLILRLEKTLALAADHGPRRVRLAHLCRMRHSTLSHASSHFWCRVRFVVQFAPCAQQQIFFLPVTFTKSITRNACRHAQCHLGLPLWIFHARMPCSHREIISRSLS